MILRNTDIGLSININNTLLDSLVDIGVKHYPNEFGGFLVGNYSPDYKELNITDTILPVCYNATKYMFERDIEGIDTQFERFFEEKPKKYYVGEWHTHPDTIPRPSNRDMKAMEAIVNHDKVSIKNPVLLIIGYHKTIIDFGFYVSFNNALYKYE